MPWRMKKVVVTVAGLALFAGGAFLFSACSSSDSPSGDAPDAAPDARKEAGPPVDSGDGEGEDAGLTIDECYAKCEADHPSGLVLDRKIDDCWEANCAGPCVDGTSGFDAGSTDAGDGGEAGADAGPPMCQNDVETDDTSCNACTQTFCCESWDGCFNDDDCAALNDCRSSCE
jgi:hypothetical protein